MAGIQRVTGPTLDVIEALLEAHQRGVKLHGWAISKATRRAGPTVYKALDRLEDAGMIVGEWEELGPDESRPRRRLYTLTGDGVPAARALLAQRRPTTPVLKVRPAPGFAVGGRLRTPFSGGAR
ncbi:PadR family transcriptional regulator [Nonomuraea sp. GTA35]|uniref:PadR family transcriptional regulator n=1 Tax=Nonomuraea sp. GTA35 TaxID=1676746 RepID=UPI0035C125FB